MCISALQSERKISFVLHEPDNESEGSSNTTVTMQVGLHMQINIDSSSTVYFWWFVIYVARVSNSRPINLFRNVQEVMHNSDF